MDERHPRTPPAPRRRAIGLKARILLICGLPLLATALATAVVVHASTRAFVEDAVGEQMVMQARIAAHLVAIAERERAAGRLDAEAINDHFKAITRFAKEHWDYDYEFWVTDSAGKVTLGSQGVEFTFSPEQEQAGEFLPLLKVGEGGKDTVIQESRKREIDPAIYKYVAVTGADMPRIVEVGYRTESLMATLSRKNLLLALGVVGLLLVSGVLAYLLLSRAVTSPLRKLAGAAQAVEEERYAMGGLADLRSRRDEMGRLASVFEDMVGRLATRYEELVNFMRSAVLKVRGDGTISFANSFAAELLGYERADLVGSPLRRLVPEEARAELQAQVESMTGEDVHVDAVRENVTSAGRRLWMAWSSRTIRAGEGSARELLYVGNDVTEAKRLEQDILAAKAKAEEATQMKSMFLANMSHEIRTPMNAIIGLSHLALKTQMTAKQRDYVSKIHNAGTSLLAIINDILDFSKIEAGRLDIEVTDFRLDDVITSVTTLTAQKAHDKGLELLASVNPRTPEHLRGDPLRLGQILTNLVNNAIKFTERGEIRLSIEPLESTGDKVELQFAVRDTGIGMTREQASRLFQPFSQADMSTTRKHGGTGLGLTICRRLVDLMGGQIWLESEPGVGSTFTCTVWLEVNRATRPGTVVPARFKELRVLVVDDNAAAREILLDSLAPIAKRVDAVSSGAEAIAAVREHDAYEPYDVVFMDWRMPGMDGLEASRQIKNDARLTKRPAIVIVTAFGRDEVREEAERLNLDGFLVKPITKSMIVDSLVGLLAPDEAAVASAAAIAETTSQGKPLQGLRVLLTEDNEINQQIAVELLEGVGASIDVANNGREAVDRLLAAGATPPYDVVLMDLQMPVMDGYQATARIRAESHLAGLPIVAMTAHATVEERQRCLGAGMNGHVSKPIDPALLFATLARFRRGPAGATEASPKEVAAPAPPPAAGLPEVPGLDAAAGLARVAGNRALYLKLLRQFADQQASAPDEVVRALERGETKVAERTAHTLKGVAGTLGIPGVQEAAGRVESAIARPDPAVPVGPLLATLRTTLGAFLARLSAALPGPGSPSASAPPAAPGADEVRAAVKEMVRHLDAFDPAAAECLDAHETVFRHVLGEEAFPRFREMVASFALSDALGALLDAARQKGIPSA